VDLSVLDTSEVDHAGELLGPRPPSSMDLSASAVTVSIPGTGRSRALTSRTQCRHRMPPTLSPIVGTRVSPRVRATSQRAVVRCPEASAGGRAGRRSRRMCPHAHQEPRGDCSRRGGVTSRQKRDSRRTGARWNLSASAASPRRSTLRERDPCLPPHPPRKESAAGADAHCRRAIRGDHGHVHHRHCLRGAVRHHGVSSRAPLTESCRTLATSQPSGEESCPKSLISHRRPQQKEYLESVSGHSVALAR
jgi:hypothetical protein